jgi:2-phospho-L-lactate guanylyltransferase (CobY/MobA/RfbA family)
VSWRTRASMTINVVAPDVLVETASGSTQAASWNYGSGRIVLSASPDIFSNRALLDPIQAELAVRLVEYGDRHVSYQSSLACIRPIVVSEFLNASDKYRGTAVLMSPGLRSGTLQLILVAVLAGWFGFHRFGPAKHVETSQRRSLTESAAAVGNLYFRTNSGHEAMDDTNAIAARTGLPPEDVERILKNAHRLAAMNSTTASAAGSAIRELSEIVCGLKGRHQMR